MFVWIKCSRLYQKYYRLKTTMFLVQQLLTLSKLDKFHQLCMCKRRAQSREVFQSYMAVHDDHEANTWAHETNLCWVILLDYRNQSCLLWQTVATQISDRSLFPLYTTWFFLLELLGNEAGAFCKLYCWVTALFLNV